MPELSRTGRDPIPMPPTHDEVTREQRASQTSTVTVTDIHDSAMAQCDLMLTCARKGNHSVAMDWALTALLNEARALSLARDNGASYTTIAVLAKSAAHIALSLSDYAQKTVAESHAPLMTPDEEPRLSPLDQPLENILAEHHALPWATDSLQPDPIGQGFLKLLLSYEAMQDALAKRILAEWNAEHVKNGTPREWPAQQEWNQLMPTSHAILWQAARREAALDDTPRFRQWLDAITNMFLSRIPTRIPR